MAEIEVRGDIVSDDMSWIYDFFDLSCCCPSMVRDAIANLADGETLTVRINSYGGDVTAGQEIYAALSSIRARVNVRVESVACSAASMIAMAGGHVSMSPVALLMIHRSWATMQGNAPEMQHGAETLATVDRAIAAAYSEKSGISETEVLDMMDRETWLSAADALAMGFVDEVIDYNTQGAEPMQAAAAFGNLSVTPDMIEKAKKARAEAEANAQAQEEARRILADLDAYGV